MNTDLEKPNQFISGIIVNVQEGNNEVEVLFSDDDEPRLINVKHIVDIEREYKVLSINDKVDRISKKPVIIIELSRMDKLYVHNGTNYNIIRTFSMSNFDLFIYDVHSNLCMEICDSPTENKIIRLSDYYTDVVNYQGKIRPAFYEAK
ncbi:MAG: hypothetical protein ACHQF4_11155 [Sphingobacteriales bacterium]